MAKRKPTTKAADRFAEKKRPTLSEAKAAAGKVTGTTAKMGRPKTSPPNMKRTSIMADGEQMHRLKIAAAKENRHIYELLADAIEDYLAK